jgi:hypothetical protein
VPGDDREILERHLRALLATKRRHLLRRRRIRRALKEDLWVAGRTPKRATYMVRHLKAQEKRLRRLYMVDAKPSTLDLAIAKAVERILQRALPRR